MDNTELNCEAVESQAVTDNEALEDASAGLCEEAVQESPAREFKLFEAVLAWTMAFLGYLFCRAVPIFENPLGGFLTVVLLFSAMAVAVRLNRVKAGKLSWVSAALGPVISAATVLSSNATLQTIAFLYSLTALCYFVYSAYGNRLEHGFGDTVLLDLIRSVAVMPFISFKGISKALFYGRARSGGRALAKIIVGAILAILPTAVVVSLLSYDKGFNELLGSIFDFSVGTLFSHIFSIVFGLLVGMYFFGLYVSSVDQKGADRLTVTQCKEAFERLKIMPQLTAAVTSLPLVLIYTVFFVSQWKYYVSAFTGVLPEEFSYAEYAREGFFQLCTVSVINLLIIMVMSVIIRRREDERPIVLKIISTVYSVCTLVLISTAISKMVMYINSYGLTRKRVYASWFMLLLAVVFVLLIIRQFASHFKIVAVTLAVSVVAFTVLALGNVDRFIAKYNVDRYLDGTLKTVDVEALYELGDSGIPEMVRLATEMDDRLGTDIKKTVKLSFINRKTDYEWVMYYELAGRV